MKITDSKPGSIIENGPSGKKAYVTSASPAAVEFVTINEKHPERFVLARNSKTGNWELQNVTLTQRPYPYTKVRYKSVSPEDVQKLFSPENILQAKIDGSAAFYSILGDKIEALSYRNAKNTGYPIVHTERAGLLDKLKDNLGDTVLRGEIYGVHKDTGKILTAAQTGGLLNATIENSWAKQRDNRTELRNMLFDILKYRGKDVSAIPYTERLKLLNEIKPALPDTFAIAPSYSNPEEQRELWEQIVSGKHPLTSEGIVAHPSKGGVPVKVKPLKESDVVIRKIFEGTGKYKGNAAGGFEYSLPNQDRIVGKVGTGLTDEDRRSLYNEPEEWIGRTARIRAQEQFPSGAYRAPAFIARHEDITQKEATMYNEDLTSMAEKWSNREHIRAALRTHLPDALNSLGTDNETKELTDLALITAAYRKKHTPQSLMEARLAKFRQYADSPSLAGAPSKDV